MTDDVIDLISSDSTPPATPVRKRPRVSLPPPDLPTPPSDGELEIVSHVIRGASETHDLSQADPAPTNAAAKSPMRAAKATAADVECVGTRVGVRALVDYPHFRFQCVVEAFKRQRAAKKERYCPRCFCYVCDIPASECKEWPVHAKAMDTVHKWRVERENRLDMRRRKSQAASPAMRRPAIARYTRPAPIRTRIEEPLEPPSADELDVEMLESDGDDELPTVDRFDDSDTFHVADALAGVSIDPDCFSFEALAATLVEPDRRGGMALRTRNRSRRQTTRAGGLR